MDIKLKNIKYSKAAKRVSVFLIWAAFAGLFASMVFVAWHYDGLRKENYFETHKYQREFRNNVSYAFNYGVTLRSEEYIRGGNTITEEMVEQGKRELAEEKRQKAEEAERMRIDIAGEPIDIILEGYETESRESKNSDKKALGSGETTVSNATVPSVENGEVTAEEIELLRQKIIKEHLERFKEVKAEIDSWVNFMYMVVDVRTGTALTNVETGRGFNVADTASKLKAQKVYVHLAGSYEEAVPLNFIHNVDPGLSKALEGTGFELYAAVEEPLSPGDAFYEAWQMHSTAHKLMPAFIVIASLSFIIGLLCFICLIISAGRGEKGGQVRLKRVDRLYNDIHTALVIFAAVISWLSVKNFYDWRNIWELAGVFVILSADLLIALSYILSMARHIKSGSLIKHTLIYNLSRTVIKFVRFCFNVKFRLVVILFLLGYGLMNGILFAAMIIDGHNTGPLTLVLLILLNIISVYLVLKALVSLSDIMNWVKGISGGNLEVYLEKPNASAAFAGFAWDIQNIQSGLRKAVFQAVKGERLKTELITNVSHDLKTPLTSIISYVDLLKKESPEGGDTKRYIEILDEKSLRLKQLIEDLIEASKVASGNIAVSLDGVDLHALIIQAEAEFRDKIIDRGLEVRIKAAEKPVMIYADGRLMWRALENLLSNVVKYSQKNSRVYIDIEHTPEHGAITIKNISENPLDVEPEQLVERFVRGEESRTTEGSGLGLSIAKSLAEIQGGRLDIVIDGDLFKASITMPLVREPETSEKSLIS
ncbi:sensor histidine kinase [Anaerobacterium chartisolvens]|uniref:sensor histidine kinase n=1 Tax=Anaerobacterium chartisolvens TaxID=1297424 RepID=UPI0014729EF7|nr:HAMP domain-containing sensor histidine kinase [Anaerobacterium chartisolvens]